MYDRIPPRRGPGPTGGKAIGGDLPESRQLEFCSSAGDASDRAARQFRDRLWTATAVRIVRAHRRPFAGSTPEHRCRFLARLKSRTQGTQVPTAIGLELAALADFLDELTGSGERS